MQNGGFGGANDPQQDIDANFGDRAVGSPVKLCRGLQEKGPSDGSSITGSNRIDIVFDPDKSKKVKKCDKIVHVQFVRRFIDGKAAKPGDVDAAFAYKDAVTVDKGWGIDFLSGETTPDYQQGSASPDRREGHKNGGSQTATIWDAPDYSGLGPKFYDRVTNPTGWKRVVLTFESYAWCMQGPDCGKWYEGVGWQYTMTWMNIRDGEDGTSKIIKKNLSGPPSKKQKQAFDKFNTSMSYTPCP
jgi:hypothetical protein